MRGGVQIPPSPFLFLKAILAYLKKPAGPARPPARGPPIYGPARPLETPNHCYGYQIMEYFYVVHVINSDVGINLTLNVMWPFNIRH